MDMDNPIKITMSLTGKLPVSRFWEVRVIQIPFTERAPVGCLQYHRGMTGIIQTMNYAENGRHLAEQDYNICIRQEEGMCSIAYEPCHEQAFRIGPNNNNQADNSPGVDTESDGSQNTNINGTDHVGVGSNGTQTESNDVLNEDDGSGNGPILESDQGRNMPECSDKIVLPCDSEYLLMMVSFNLLSLYIDNGRSTIWPKHMFM